MNNYLVGFREEFRNGNKIVSHFSDFSFLEPEFIRKIAFPHFTGKRRIIYSAKVDRRRVGAC